MVNMYNMKNQITALVMIFISINLYAQTPKIKWVKSFGGEGNDRANSIASDENGNTIVVGRFQSKTMTVDKFTLTKSKSELDEQADVFIIKLNKKGKAIWALSAGSTLDDHALSCTTDKQNNIYVVGYFESETLSFGDVVLKNNNFTNAAEGVRYNSDMWVGKFSPEGKCLWARNAGGLDGNGQYSRIILDSQNNVIVGGIAGGEMHFGNGVSLILEKMGMYVAKYSNDGDLLWVKSTFSVECQGVGADGEGNVVAGGFFGGKVNFDHLELTSNAKTDGFIVKYNDKGEVLWARNFGGDDGEICSSVADRFGNIYLGGLYFSKKIESATDTLINNGSINAFLVKYDKDGNQLWARSAGGDNGDKPGTATREFHVDYKGNVFCTGSNWSEFSFAGKTIKTVAGSEDIFLMKYDKEGNELWAVDYGGSGRNTGRGITTDKKGHIYLTGSFDEQQLKIEKHTLSNAGDSDIFIVKYKE